jgi:hypothetical protein
MLSFNQVLQPPVGIDAGQTFPFEGRTLGPGYFAIKIGLKGGPGDPAQSRLGQIAFVSLNGRQIESNSSDSHFSVGGRKHACSNV